MKNLTILVCFLLFVGAGTKKKAIENVRQPKTINGEVFIVTQGGNNIKLGLVTVYFLTEKQYKLASDTNSQKYLLAVDIYNRLDSLKLKYENSKIIEQCKKEIDKLEQFDRENTHKGLFDDKINALKRKISDAFIASNSFVRFSQDQRALRGCVYDFVKKTPPDSIISDVTNSDAKFSAVLKDSIYYVFAEGSRKVADKEEEYHWLVKYSPSDKILLLSNNNMMNK